MKNKSITITLIFIFALLLLGILGFSYAYFEPTLSSQGNNNLIVSKDLRLLFNDDSISEGEIYPGESYSKKFTVTNKASNISYYEIKWKDYINTFTNDEMHIELKCVSYINYTSGTKAVSGTCEGFEDKAVTSDSLKEGIGIASGKTHEYEVILTFIETGSNQDHNKGKVFNGTLDVAENVLLTTNLNGGTSTQTLKTAYEIGETIELYEPYKAGHVFLNWNASGRGTSLNGNILTIGDATATLTANFLAYANMYTYTGSSTLTDDGNGNWRIKFLTSGTFTPQINMAIDAFLVGGGGGGSGALQSSYEGSGGGGGYTTTGTSINCQSGTGYFISVGGGGSGGAGGSNGGSGSATTAFGYTANGGSFGQASGKKGGDGGSGGGSGVAKIGGTNGGNGDVGSGYTAGIGQVISTREFKEISGTLYAGGGGSSNGSGGSGGGGTGALGTGAAVSGSANYGGGGGGGSAQPNASRAGASGGSGIVVIRKAKIQEVGNTVKYYFSYSGWYTVENANTDNWKVKFLESGNFKAVNNNIAIDAFLVGGGGGGSGAVQNSYEGSGGGSGYTTTGSSFTCLSNTVYPIVIGTGGYGGSEGTNGGNGTATTAFGYTANGGSFGQASGKKGGNGGCGGGGGIATGGSNGSNSGTSGGYGYTAGIGQTVTTREFAEPTGVLYAGGGGGSNMPGGAGGGGYGSTASNVAISGTVNSGGGGGGGSAQPDDSRWGASGGSGIVVIRRD